MTERRHPEVRPTPAPAPAPAPIPTRLPNRLPTQILTQMPTLIPGPLAAREAGVAPATIRKWVQLGRLAAVGRAGRAHLFRLEDVFAAERAAHHKE